MLSRMVRIGSIQFVLMEAIQMTTEIPVKATEFDLRIAIVRQLNLDYQQIDSDKLHGVIRLPIQLSKTVGRDCSGPVCSLGSVLGD